jgi:hypothetical protein
MRRLPLVSIPAAFLALFLAGCGHPATREDCERIIDKTAELKLKEDNVKDEDIPKQIQGYKEARGDEAVQKCVGRTITKEALTCVQMAQTSDALDKCLY